MSSFSIYKILNLFTDQCHKLEEPLPPVHNLIIHFAEQAQRLLGLYVIQCMCRARHYKSSPCSCDCPSRLLSDEDSVPTVVTRRSSAETESATWWSADGNRWHVVLAVGPDNDEDNDSCPEQMVLLHLPVRIGKYDSQGLLRLTQTQRMHLALRPLQEQHWTTILLLLLFVIIFFKARTRRRQSKTRQYYYYYYYFLLLLFCSWPV